MLNTLYRPALALLTDLYELTMACAYWKTGHAADQAVFCLSFRENPFGGGYAVMAGLETVVQYLQNLRFEADDLSYLAQLRTDDGTPLFDPAFLDLLQNFRWECDLDAIPEGTVVFADEPLLRVTGPIWQAQLVESFLLNTINFQTLIATKAARICDVAGDQPVLEFGLRRAQGIDGALAASRAAYIGGCAATSNTLAGRLLGIPVRGTMAHSWIMLFDDEIQAFQAYASAMPHNALFLVDTYDTLQGVRHAIQVGRQLKARGYRLLGIRLDSGDLAYLSIQARRMLDEAGFPDAKILASNELDEHILKSLKEQGAAINLWGVGTRLVVGHGQGALGGVYKLTAVRPRGRGPWQLRLKVSELAAKTSIPGVLAVRRYFNGRGLVGDLIYDQARLGPPHPNQETWIVDPADITRRKRIPPKTDFEDLLVPVFRKGQLVYDLPSLTAIRQRAREQVARLHPGIRRFLNPHAYPVGLEERLANLRMKMILQARKRRAAEASNRPTRKRQAH